MGDSTASTFVITAFEVECIWMWHIFSKDIARYCWYNAAVLHMSQPYVGAVFWGGDRLTPAKISRSFLTRKGGWLMLGFTRSPQQLLQHYTKMRNPCEKKKSVFLLWKPQPEHLVCVLILTTNLFCDLPQDTMSSSASVSFRPSRCVCCELLMILLSKGILSAFIISKQWGFCVQIFSTSHTTYHPEESWRNEWAVHCRRLHIAVDISAFTADPKSAEVEEFYITSAQTSP